MTPAAEQARPAPAWRQAGILAAGTWRLAWREPLTRLLLALAVLLAVVGAIAARGSPGAGNGAIQMLAVCLQIVPFAVVLLAGDLWRRDADETAVFARPVAALTYVCGRAAGLCLVGLGLLLAVTAASVLGLWAIARLPLAGDLGYCAVFAAVYVAPGILLLAGACFWWLARGGAGPRYHAAVILGALLVAFYDYKLDALAGQLRALAFFAPFPGFLTLGLALPPPLLGYPAVPGWLWLNRGVFTLLGCGLLLLAARRRSLGFPRLPLRRARAWRSLLGAAALGVLALGLPLALLVPRLAPGVLPRPPRIPAAAAVPALTLTLKITADAASGRLQGTAAWAAAGATPARGERDYYLLLNAGLRLQVPAADRLDLPDGRRLVPGTAARLYRVRAAGPALQVSFAGQLLPAASALPYPPFPPGQVFEGAALGAGRAFFNGRGTWYPLLVGPGLQPASPSNVRLALTLTGTRWPWFGAAGSTWNGPTLPPVLGAAAPFRSFSGPGFTLRADAPPSPAQRAVLGTYARAARALHAVLPAAFGAGALPVAVSPLLTHPLLSAGTLWIPGNQPFCVPPDPVAGDCSGGPPPLEAATLLLARLAWQEQLGLPGGNLALAPTAADAAAQGQVAPEAAVAAWRALGQPAPIAAAWTAAAVLPVLGGLDAAQRTAAAALAEPAAPA